MTNLLQARLNITPQPPKIEQANSRRKPANVDFQNEINKKNLIKPLKAKGKLVNNNIFNTPVIMAKNLVYDTKALKHAIKGEANDHELGRLNNLGLFAGGLGIASYLFTRRQIPTEKGMEFIGLGSFIASMAIWPKIAIQLPAYLIHGVNVHKQYEDSFGRRKPFYQDPQFIPWDLYTDEQIHKLGDRLRVDKNMPNRREFIQEKMRKLAVQNNTLWMLTAGFATPVMSSLICSQLQPYLLKYVNNHRNKEADNILDNFNDYTKKHEYKQTSEKLEKLFAQHKNAPLDENLRGQIIETFTEELDSHTANSFINDFNKVFSIETFKIDHNSAKALNKNLYERFAGQNFSEDLLKALFKDENWTSEVLERNNWQDAIVGKNIDFEDIKSNFIKEIHNNYNEYHRANPNVAKEDWKLIKTIILNNNESQHPISLAIKKVSGEVLDETMLGKLKTLASAFDKFVTNSEALNKYACLKIGSAPETVAANYWNKTAEDLLKILNFSSDEIKKTRMDENIFGPLLRNKIEAIASNQETYNRVVSSIIERIGKIDEVINPENMKSHILRNEDNLPFETKQNIRTNYEKQVDEVFDSFANSLRDDGFEKTAKAIAGLDTRNITGDPNTVANLLSKNNIGTAKNIQKAFVEERILGIKSSFYRLINTLDVYRRIATDADNIKGIQGQYREIKEELLELCKTITLEGHSSDFANKFYMKRNPHPNTEVSDVVVENGKVKNLFYGKAQTTDISGDYYFFKQGMEAMFESDIHPDTKAIIENSPIKEELHNYRRLVYERVGGQFNFAKQRHRTVATDAPSDIKFLLTGISPKEFFFKNIQNSFNTKTWLKMFGGLGAGLLGVTVLAQFFLGRIKNPQKAGKHD